MFSNNAEADREFLNQLGLTHVDVGDGWFIYGLPPSEVAVHPSEHSVRHEFYFLCDDINEFVQDMRTQGVTCSAIEDEGWGLLTEVSMPGGGKLGVYEPRHARPGSS
jgi:hypothetical protein